MIGILGEHQYLLNINVHIIDYIGLCMYTSTCLYIILICMYIHIYIYTYYIYIYIRTRVLGIQLHVTPSTHDFLQSTEVIFTQKLPARCRLSWASQPFRIVQTADVAIATPAVSSRCSHIMSTVIWMSTVFAERLQSFLQIFLIQTPSQKNSKFEVRIASGETSDSWGYDVLIQSKSRVFPLITERYWLVTNLPIYHLFTTKSGGAWKFSSSSFAEPCKQFAFRKKSSKNDGL